jgi:hypothetical protein
MGGVSEACSVKQRASWLPPGKAFPIRSQVSRPCDFAAFRVGAMSWASKLLR